MTTKKTLIGSSDIKRSVGDLRKLLSDSPSMTNKIRFKRYGKHYTITNDNSELHQKLEDSFNSFMGKLEVEKGRNVRGVCFLGDLAEEFNICYQKNHEATLHQIRGRLAH